MAGGIWEWGELELNSFGYRPKFSGLLTILKRAAPGERLRSGRLDWRMKNGMTINWTQEWKIGVTSSCPPKIVLSRDKLFGVEDKSLSTYIEELAIQGAPYLYLGGGYVYHEHSTASWGLLGDNFSWQASAYLGRAYTGIGGNPATRFNYSPTTLFSVGSSTSYKHVSHLGRRTPLWEWDNIDDAVTGVSWEEALIEPAYGVAGID